MHTQVHECEYIYEGEQTVFVPLICEIRRHLGPEISDRKISRMLIGFQVDGSVGGQSKH